MSEMRNGPREGAVGPIDQPSAGYAPKSSPQPAREQTLRLSGRVCLYVDGFNLYYGMHTKAATPGGVPTRRRRVT